MKLIKIAFLSGLMFFLLLFMSSSNQTMATPWAVLANDLSTPHPTDTGFRFVMVEIINGELRWEVDGEVAQGQYRIETLLNNNWTTAQVVPANSLSRGSYAFRLSLVGSLANIPIKYRVAFTAPQSKELISPEVELLVGEITFYPVNVTDNLHFSQSIRYQIVTPAGQTMLKGSGTSVDCRQLAPGLYYLMFDSRKERFVKK
jgi:hypothetical protein